MSILRGTRRANLYPAYPVDQILGVVPAAALFNHLYNGVVGWTVTTVPSASSIQLRLRQLDGNNHFRWNISSTGSISLDEIVATVVTGRGTSSAGVVTAGSRCVVVLDWTTLTTYVNGSIISALTYTAASNFLYEIVGKLQSLATGGVVSDVRSWRLQNRSMEGV